MTRRTPEKAGGREGTEFSTPSSTLLLYQRIFDGMHAMSDTKYIHIIVITSDTLSNSLVLNVPTNYVAL